MKIKTIKIVAIVALIASLGFVYHYKYLNEFPSHVHAWAQSDRYALSLGFVENGLNFFKPQTFIYNHQFPHTWQIPSGETITAVDFPIHDFIPAFFMKMTGNFSPWIFRLYVLLYSFFGLFFLFKLSYAVTGNYLKSVFVTVFAATSPVFVYYQGGFLPTIPSLSNAIIGIYFYYQYLRNEREVTFWLTVFFLTLAALARTTFAIPLIAVLNVELLRIIRKETTLIAKLLPVSLSALALLFYLFYNGYLRKTYGSVFLNHILPPENFVEAQNIIKHVYESLKFHYFTIFHYFIYILIFVIAFIFTGTRINRVQKVKLYFAFLTVVYFMGCCAFALLMLRQFPAHDYYFLDTFFFPILMSFLFFLSIIPETVNKNFKFPFIAGFVALAMLMMVQPVKSQKNRRDTGFRNRMSTTINNYANASVYLDSLGIPESSKILVMDSDAPNIPFILMKRKGFVVMNTTKANIEKALTWDFDYIVLQKEDFFSDIYSSYPAILSRLDKFADNGKITVCKLSENNSQSLHEFLGFNKENAVYQKVVTFEGQSNDGWQNFTPTKLHAYSGDWSGHLTSETEFGLTYKENNLPILQNGSRSLLFSSWFLTDTEVNCLIVVAISSNGENIYYKTYNIHNFINKRGVWEHASLLFRLPQIHANEFEFGIYIWNTGKSELYYDDFGFSLYQ